jgi:hypothetical protein
VDIRAKLREEYFRLDNLRREAKVGSVKRRELWAEQCEVEKKIDKIRFSVSREIERADSYIFVHNVSVFDCESSYSGPTSHGSSLGDGNYWNRGGHN